MMTLLTVGVLALAAPETFVLNAPENVWDVVSEDFNQDGRGDLLALCCDEKSDPLRKQAVLFPADAAGAYAETPSFSLPLAPETGALFLSEFDGAPPREVVAVTGEGARICQYKDGALVLLEEISFVSLFPSGSKEPAFLENISEDVDGDGRDEWFVPMPLSVEVRRAGAALARIPCDVVSEIRSGANLSVWHRIPAVQVVETPNETLKGLAFLSDEYADFAFGQDWAQRARFRIPVNLEEKWESDARMADINRDGAPDIMVTQTKGTVNLEVLTQVYIATAPYTYAEKPSATFRATGSIADGVLRDVDGDEDLDMIYIRVPFGARNVMNFILRGKVHVEADVYLFDGDAFPDKPAFQDGLTIDAPEGREQVGHALADFDGDKRIDLALAASRDAISVYRGSEDRFIEKDAWQTLSVPGFGVARVLELGGGPGKDIALYHPSGDNRKRIDVIVF